MNSFCHFFVLIPHIPNNLIIVIVSMAPVLPDYPIDVLVVFPVAVGLECFAVFIGHVSSSVMVSRVMNKNTNIRNDRVH